MGKQDLSRHLGQVLRILRADKAFARNKIDDLDTGCAV
jgi:hypothetical protein